MGHRSRLARLLRIGVHATHHEIIWRQQRLLTMGRAFCDVNFPLDGFVSERHLQLSQHGDADGSLLLEDLHSRNGTYIRVRKPTKLTHGDLLLLGEQVLRVELLQ
jgi:pSer/pThr/pTyr-binding forkhead associated (FHA) protein